MKLKTTQVKNILETYEKLASIRQTAKLLNLKNYDVYKVLIKHNKVNPKKLKETNEKQCFINVDTKVKDNNKTISKLVENLTIGSLKKLKKDLKELKPNQIALMVTGLIDKKIKLDALKQEDQKISLVKELFGSYSKMLELRKEILEANVNKTNVLITKTKELTG